MSFIKREYELINKSLAFNVEGAKRFVFEHRNIFNDSTRRYVISDYPIVIKEINKYEHKTSYWFWVFLPNKRLIYEFNKKPKQKELQQMWNDIKKEKKQGDINVCSKLLQKKC